MAPNAVHKHDAAAMPPILDVRPRQAFEERHRVGAVNIPLEELAGRVHELPPPVVNLLVYDANATRARWAASRMRARGRQAAAVVDGAEWLSEGPVEVGPCRAWLWQPHPLLVEFVQYARKAWGAFQGRSAVDLACGSGRDAVFLAIQGFVVEAWDILPDALARCEDLARRHNAGVKTRRRNLEAAPEIAPMSFEVVCCFNFLHRPLMPVVSGAVRSGGFVIYETFVHPQRDLFGKPGRDAHVLRGGELREWFQDWELCIYREGIVGPRRLVASLVARKP
jgi:SAM-dependent methyltransferase